MNCAVTDIELALEYAHSGSNPTTITQVNSGWVFLGLNQVLKGCCLLVAEPVINTIADLDKDVRNKFFDDMLMVGKAITNITGAAKCNYLLLGNKDPVLHVHIIPRFSDEPKEYQEHGPWKYKNYVKFEIERDLPLILELKNEIDRLASK